MDNNNDNYSNRDVLNLFFIHGECNKILDRTCRTFNERYPNLPHMTKKKFRKIESNFLRFGNALTKKNVQKLVTNNEQNEINVLAYFNVHPNASVSAASVDSGKF